MAVTILNQANFEETINSGKTVLVDFFATWCGPCKMLAPVLEEISNEVSEDKIVAKLDIDQNMEIARQFRIMSVPTMITFKNGAAVFKMIGVHEKDEIVSKIDETAKKAESAE
ncbi:MAG: thioredoxin [Clostridia bacterium]|nr:thioredoxin [Clostridia bacterium]